MNFYPIKEETRPHLLKLIEWLFEEVKSAGGDGDALWYSKFYDTKEIFELVKEYNDTLKRKWDVKFDEKARTIYICDMQEEFMITNDKSLLDNAPSWQQCIVVH